MLLPRASAKKDRLSHFNGSSILFIATSLNEPPTPLSLSRVKTGRETWCLATQDGPSEFSFDRSVRMRRASAHVSQLSALPLANCREIEKIALTLEAPPPVNSVLRHFRGVAREAAEALLGSRRHDDDIVSPSDSKSSCSHISLNRTPEGRESHLKSEAAHLTSAQSKQRKVIQKLYRGRERVDAVTLLGLNRHADAVTDLRLHELEYWRDALRIAFNENAGAGARRLIWLMGQSGGGLSTSDFVNFVRKQLLFNIRDLVSMAVVQGRSDCMYVQHHSIHRLPRTLRRSSQLLRAM